MRERIIAAFTELASAKGFSSTTVNELARQAGLSKRTIYRYFESKDEIIEAVVDSFMHKLSAEIEEITAKEQPPELVFSAVVDCFYRAGHRFFNPLVLKDISRQYPQIWKRIDEFRVSKVQGVIQKIVGNTDPKAVRAIDPRIMTTVFIASVQAVLNPEYLLSHGLTPYDAGRQLMEFFMHGFFDPGRAET